MKSKNIVFTKPNTAELITEDVKPIGENEVLVRLAVSAISSGTERANLVGEVNVNWTSDKTVADFPRRVGYSSAGVVEAIGEKVTSVKVGDRVALSWSKHAQFY